MDGSGRWIEKYEEPEEVTYKEACRWLCKHKDLSLSEALQCIVAYSADDEKDILEELGVL